ncbi:MAG TPA: Spy/CpxP family protein refolding chaperone [Dongiaceae bacterium]|nr:Spy/CpxP family protein refolding chaperone [Dongiaceae bacterium]
MTNLNKLAILGAFLITITPALADDIRHQSDDSNDMTVVIKAPSNMRPNGMMADMMSSSDLPIMPLPEMMKLRHIAGRLAFRERMIRKALDHPETMDTAIKPLYAALNDEQRRTADELRLPESMAHI